MKTRSITLALLALCGLVAIPQNSQAFEVVDSSVERLNDTTALFTISYEFGFLNRDLRMPAATVRGETAHSDRVSYQFVTSEGAVLNGFGPAIVLSNDEDVTFADDMYYVPRGKNGTFTLTGLLQLPANEPFSNIRMVVEHLPFTLLADENTRSGGSVPADQLSDYRTPFISITENLTISGQTTDSSLPLK